MNHFQEDLCKPLQQCNGIFFVFFSIKYEKHQSTDLN